VWIIARSEAAYWCSDVIMGYCLLICRRNLIAILLIAILLAPSVLFGQRRSGGSRPVPGRNPSGLSPDQVHAAVADFQGILRTFDKKKILVETEDGQTLTFRRTKSTQFLAKDGGQKLPDLGKTVQVEARKENTGDLEAVRVCEGICK
jgi:hypothetical protein